MMFGNSMITATCIGNAALKESRHWGPDVPVESEYSTYSESQVQVYYNDELISSTRTVVSVQQLVLNLGRKTETMTIG